MDIFIISSSIVFQQFYNRKNRKVELRIVRQNNYYHAVIIINQTEVYSEPCADYTQALETVFDTYLRQYNS